MLIIKRIRKYLFSLVLVMGFLSNTVAASMRCSNM